MSEPTQPEHEAGAPPELPVPPEPLELPELPEIDEPPPPAAPPAPPLLRPPRARSRRDPALPPHDQTAERAVIAALLLDADAWAGVRTLVEPADFFDEGCGWCYESALALADRGVRITIPTLAHELERAGRLDRIGGEPWLAELLGEHLSAVGAEAHASIVARDALYRRMIGAAGQIARIAYEGGPDQAAAISLANSLLLAVGDGEQHERRASYAEAISEYRASHGPLAARGEPLRSGFAGLDMLLQGGFGGGDLVVVAARTGMGKTSLLLRLARNAVVGQPQHGSALIFSLEMGRGSLAARMISAESDVRISRVAPGAHSPEEAERIEIGDETLLASSLVFFDDPAISVPDIRAHCLREREVHPIGAVLIDYLQLLTRDRESADRREPRALEIARITRSLKALARELEVPVLAAAQLNRGVEQRQSRVPLLSDLRESGTIEQDADIVIFIDRDGDAEGEVAGAGAHFARLIVAKHRNGPTGAVGVRWVPHTASFEDMVVREPPAGQALDEPKPWI